MSDNEKETTSGTNTSEADEFARLFSNFMRKSFMQNQPPEIQTETKPEKVSYKTDSQPLTVGFKLNGDNYPLWSILMHNAINGRGMVSHITGVPTPPLRTDPTFTQWQTADHCTWLVQNIETKLVSRVAQQPTAKHIWDNLAVTYASGGDTLQTYDLHRRASTLKQGNSTLEELWTDLNEIWTATDQKRPNRMKDPEDIQIHNEETEQDRLYQLLTALNDKYEHVKREVLKIEPLPSTEQAYNIVKREDVRAGILRASDGKSPGDGIGAGLFTARDGGDRTPLMLHAAAAAAMEGGISGAPTTGEQRKTSPNCCAHTAVNENTPRINVSSCWGIRTGRSPSTNRRLIVRHGARATPQPPSEQMEGQRPSSPPRATVK